MQLVTVRLKNRSRLPLLELVERMCPAGYAAKTDTCNPLCCQVRACGIVFPAYLRTGDRIGPAVPTAGPWYCHWPDCSAKAGEKGSDRKEKNVWYQEVDK